MHSLNNKVKILSTGLVGTVVDVYEHGGRKVYVVESDTINADFSGGYGNTWKLFDCYAGDLASI